MKNIIKLVLLIVFSCFSVAYAETSEITSAASVTEQTVTISGQISNISASHQVILLVGSTENIIYINQKATQANGAFEFVFSLPDNLPDGSYEYKIGSSADTAVHSGIIEYTSIVTEQRKFIEADIDITISGYKPVISGTLYCTEGKTIELNIKNISDNTVLSNETITSEDGVFNISHTLPSLLSTKEYEVSIVCSENNTELANLSAVIDSSILLVDILGTARTADNVSINAQLQSVNTGLSDKNATFTGNESLSVTIPNLVSNASFHLFAEGYETVVVEPSEPEVPVDPEPEEPVVPEPEITEYVHTVNGTANDIFKIIASANNVVSFDDKVYTVEYNDSQIELVSLFGNEHEDVVAIGKKDNVNILSHQSGVITFKMEDIEIAEGNEWRGILNVFKFKFKPNYTGETSLKISR